MKRDKIIFLSRLHLYQKKIKISKNEMTDQKKITQYPFSKY
jgi:hypothetical protein